jgi:hypothetical protein
VAARIAPGQRVERLNAVQAADVADGALAITVGLLDGVAVWRGFVDIKALPRPVRSTPRRFLVAESRDHFVASSLSDGGPTARRGSALLFAYETPSRRCARLGRLFI